MASTQRIKLSKSDAYSLSGCNFSKHYIKAQTPPEIDSTQFGGTQEYLGVPIGCKTVYEESVWHWRFSTIEEVEF